jgi:dolichol-phosphate mannosyltransferase
MLSISALFFAGVVMFALGILGEYIGFINQRTLRLPLVVERSRQNVPARER